MANKFDLIWFEIKHIKSKHMQEYVTNKIYYNIESTQTTKPGFGRLLYDLRPGNATVYSGRSR